MRDFGRAAAALAATILMSAATAAPAAAAAGTLDTTFGNGGFATNPLGLWVAGTTSAVQPNGRIVTVGEANVNKTNVLVSSRLLPDGALDATYGVGGWAVVPIGKTAGGAAIALQPNGDILLAGTGRDPMTGVLALSVVRLLPNGLPDLGFGNAGIASIDVGTSGVANAIAVRPNGQIVVGGSAVTDQTHFVAAQLNPNGTINKSFGTNGVTVLAPVGAAWGMDLQSNGDVVLAGQEQYNGATAYMAARLLPNGALDTGFAKTGIATIPIANNAVGLATALQSNGDILMTGVATTTTTSGGTTTNTNSVATVRLLPSGALDPTFGTGGIASAPGGGVNAMAVQPNGKIVEASVGVSVGRLNANGTVDTTFGKRGFVYVSTGKSDAANGVTIDPSGNIVLTGVATVNGQMSQLVARLQGS